MKKLEDIRKRNIHKVPEQYFDTLPGMIQARISRSPSVTVWRPAFSTTFKLALPAIALIAILTIWILPENQQKAEDNNVESILSSIDTDELVEFLTESGVSHEEIYGSANRQDSGTLDTMDLPEEHYDEILDEYESDLNP